MWRRENEVGGREEKWKVEGKLREEWTVRHEVIEDWEGQENR